MIWQSAEPSHVEGLVVYTYLLDLGKGLFGSRSGQTLSSGLSRWPGHSCGWSRPKDSGETEAELLHHYLQPQGGRLLCQICYEEIWKLKEGSCLEELVNYARLEQGLTETERRASSS